MRKSHTRRAQKDYWIAVLLWYCAYLHFVLHARAIARGRGASAGCNCCWRGVRSPPGNEHGHSEVHEEGQREDVKEGTEETFLIV